MTEDLSKVLEIEDKPDTKGNLPDKTRWPRSACLSLWSLLAAIGLIIVGMVAIASGWQTGWLLGSVKEPFETTAAMCLLAAALAILTCIVSGFVAAPRRPVVLCWVIPLVFAIVFLVWRIIESL